MAEIIRHKGYIQATGTRCAVVFRELPGDTEHCLILESDSLPEVYRDEVAKVVAKEGQKTKDLYEALNMQIMPTGENMLSALHNHRLLRRKATNEIVMQVTNNDTIRLDKLNDQLRALTDVSTVKQPQDIQAKLNPYEEVNDNVTEADAMNIAKNLLVQANDLELEVQKKRDRAYTLRPELRPVQDDGSEGESKTVFILETEGLTEKDALAQLKVFLKNSKSA